MGQSFRDLPRTSQIYTVLLTLLYLSVVALGLHQERWLIVIGLTAIFAASHLVQPLPNPTGGQLFPNNSVKIVAALLWQPPEVMLGVGVGSFLGLLFFRRSELWRALSNGVGWGISSGTAALAAHLVFQDAHPGLVQLVSAALLAVVANRIVNECIFSAYRAQRFGRPFLPDWFQNVVDQWYSQILAAPLAIVLAVAAIQANNVWIALAFTSLSVILLPIPRQELTYYHRSQQMVGETVEAVVRSLEGVDPTARAHGDRVSALTARVGRRLGMSELQLRAMLLASRLHDVGVLGNPEEISADTHHAAIGGRILSRLPDPAIAAIVRAHHEKWDGTGLPDHRKGRNIPLGARILAAAEIYDSAIAGLPPFDVSMTAQEAGSYLISLAGTVLDPKVVMALLATTSEETVQSGATG